MSKKEQANKRIDKQKREYVEAKNKLDKIETNYIEKKRAELPEYLDERLNDLCNELAKNYDEEEGISALQIMEWIKQPITTFGATPKYTAEELSMVFDYYSKSMVEINKYKKTRFIPSKPSFCLFAGITTTTYDHYLNDVTDRRKREVMQCIDEYIRDMQLQSGAQGKSNAIVSIFRTKAEHGMYEAQAPKNANLELNVDISTIRNQLNAVQSGKSLDMAKGKDGIYRVDEETKE